MGGRTSRSRFYEYGMHYVLSVRTVVQMAKCNIIEIKMLLKDKKASKIHYKSLFI